MKGHGWKTLPFETAVRSRGSGNAGLPQKEWEKSGRFPVIGQGAEEIEGWTNREDLMLTPSPAVVLYGGHTRRAKHVSQPFVPGPNVKILQPVPELDSKFLYYFLTQLPIESKGYADHFPLVRKCEVPVPPLTEQQRIVGLLDEAFAGLATAQAHAEENHQNARALFESHLQSVFTQRDGGWPTKQLGDVCDFEGGSQPPKSEFLYTPKAGYVRFLQIRDFGSEKHVTFIPESKKNRLCRADDIMIGRYGASVGKILTGKAGAYNVALMKTIPDLAQLERSFFHHYLISGAFQGRLTNVAARSAQNGFSQEDIYGFPVPVPPLEEQQKVIEQLGPLSEETQRLATLYERKQAALAALKQSLLHQAFTGNL